jgi:predicted lactoylglutathione lyase
MSPGAFSLSLAVQDLSASRAFYEGLGFTALPPSGEGGAWERYGTQWLMLSADGVVIGLFEQMIEVNTLTFNPADLRGLVTRAKAAGVQFLVEPEGEDGPAQAVAVDPDGNALLFDQLDG